MLMSRMPPAPLPAWVPGQVAKVIHTSLAHDPRRRYQAAVEMQQALEAVISQLAGVISDADIAHYLNDHLAERIAGRRKAIQLALELLENEIVLAQAISSIPSGSRS